MASCFALQASDPNSQLTSSTNSVSSSAAEAIQHTARQWLARAAELHFSTLVALDLQVLMLLKNLKW
jgi:hypothetical protein